MLVYKKAQKGFLTGEFYGFRKAKNLLGLWLIGIQKKVRLLQLKGMQSL